MIINSIDNGARESAQTGKAPSNSESKKQFKQIQYQEMIDESKHTEDNDISRSDFTET